MLRTYLIGLLLQVCTLAGLAQNGFTFLNATGTTTVCENITANATISGKYTNPRQSWTCGLGAPYDAAPSFTLGADGPVASAANTGTGTYQVNFSSPVSTIRVWVFVLTNSNNYLYDPFNNIITTGADSLRLFINGSQVRPAAASISHLPGYDCSSSPTALNGAGMPILVHPQSGSVYLQAPSAGQVANACIEIVLQDYLNIHSFRIDNDAPFGPNGVGVRVAASCAPSLPVKLLHFSAEQKTADEVMLHWATATESNTSHFVVEAAEGTAPNAFLTVGEVKAAGNTNARRDYHFVHRQPLVAAGRYYRIRMVDLDGSYQYSPVQYVQATLQPQVSVSPNPSAGMFYLNLDHPSLRPLQLVVYNSTGTLQKQWQVSDANRRSIPVDLSGQSYAPGMYVLVISNGAATRTLRLVKY